MPRLKNVTQGYLSVSNEPWLPAGVNMTWAPGESKDLFSSDFTRSRGIKYLMGAGSIVIVGQNQPGDDGPSPVATASVAGYGVVVQAEPEPQEPEPEPEPEPQESEVPVPPPAPVKELSLVEKIVKRIFRRS